MKKILKYLGLGLFTIIGVLVLYGSIAYSPTYVYHVLVWQDSDAFDWQKFPNHPLSASPTPYHFTSSPDPREEELHTQLSGADDWDSFMEANGTQAFIVIQDGNVLYENYYNDTQRDSIVTSFSLAKSFDSALIGKAIEEGYINSVDDPITTYLPELAERDPKFNKITIRHLLLMAMRTGKESEGDELTAHEIRIEFAEGAGQNRPRNLQADDAVRWSSTARKTVPGRKAEPGRILTAAKLEMAYSELGDSLDKGNASGGVSVSVLPVPGSQGSPIRKLEAERVRFGFYPMGNRMRDLDGEGDVHVTYQRTKPGQGTSAEEVRTTGEKLHATFRESDGQADKVSQWGHFTYQDGTRIATSGRADYDGGSEVLVLRESPKVTDQDSTTTGEELTYNLEGREIVVSGDVRSVTRPKLQKGTPVPAVTQSSAPTIVTAKAMRYWTEEGRARYEARR